MKNVAKFKKKCNVNKITTLSNQLHESHTIRRTGSQAFNRGQYSRERQMQSPSFVGGEFGTIRAQ